MAKKASVKKISAHKTDFLVVGLGASAGGVRALQEFFASMPANSGMAFVVILHLSPQHESSLPQILQAQTTMPVVQVRETHRVEPNHVYVIPPNRQLEMVDGTIRCAPPVKKMGARVAIDVFFRTLAEAYQKNAVCIVMSGTGSDGTLGLKRIKESNGFAIVQSPEDADYDQMPRSAIATGLADWILPVRRMPDKLIHFRESSERMHLTNSADAERVAEEINAEESLREVLTILKVRTGHDFTNYKKPTLVRRLARHLQIHELQDLPSYIRYLRENPDEAHFLQRNLLINVTNFFRDREAFAALEAEVIPRIFADKTARDTVRVWVVGCASGEEAYSIAMLLTEHAERHADPPKMMVFATDIDDEAIAQARDHVYPETIETDVAPERLKRFFLKDGSRYRIKKELREMVLFAPHNVLRDPPFSRLDLVSCRNLLIYFNREAQKRVMEIFHFALNPDGFLFVGGSESAENVPDLFEATNKKMRIYRRRPALHGHSTLPRLPVAGNWQVSAPLAEKFAGRAKTPSLSEVHFKLLENLAPPSVLINENFEVVYMSQSVGRYLHFMGGEPTNNLLKLVNPDLVPDVRAALFTAQRGGQPAEFPNVRVNLEGREILLNIIVRRVGDGDAADENFLLVVFNEGEANKSSFKARAKKAGRKSVSAADDAGAMATIVNRLEDELQRTRLNLRATIEQHEVSIEELKASNEELQAINEELRSATEELETSREELQSVNEEMNTINSELKDKIEESARANSDLQNLISSTDIATIFLDRKLHIKRFSPLVERLFNITPTDIGRPLAHFTHNLDYHNLTADAAEALKTLQTFEREISDKDGRYFLTRFSPYRTIDDRIEGVVLNFLEITKHRRTEEALREAQEKYRARLEQEVEARTAELNKSREQFASLVENTPDVITRWDANLKLIYANGAFEKKTGVANETSLGKTLQEMGQPDEIAAPFMAKLRRVFETGETAEHYNSFPTPAGEAHFHSRIVPEKNARGETETVLAIARNITDSVIITARAESEQALRESEERFRAFVKLSSDVVYCMNADWSEMRFLEGKNFIADSEETGNWLEKYIYADDRTEVLRRIREAVRTKSVFDLEHRVVRVDGTLGWTHSRAMPLLDEAGEITGWFGTASDATEKKRGEFALFESRTRLDLLMESIKDYAIITTDLHGNVIDWNAGAENIFGWTAEEMIGHPADIIFTPDDLANQVPEKERETARKNGRAADERWHLRKDGTRFYVSGMLTPLSNGELEGFVKIARDQTAKMQAEKNVQEKEMLRRLVAGQEDERRRIARDIHDHFGQQITALRLQLDALKKACGEREDLCALTEAAQKSAAALDEEVDFIAWELRPAALDDLGLRAALADFVREWSNHTGIEADYHSTGMARARLSYEIETNLYRIAQEALNNTQKHAQATRVSVLLEKIGKKVSLIVEDNGVGFDPRDHANQRRGLGLIGMRERARICGGELEIESSKGAGVTVFARVPAKK